MSGYSEPVSIFQAFDTESSATDENELGTIRRTHIVATTHTLSEREGGGGDLVYIYIRTTASNGTESVACDSLKLSTVFANARSLYFHSPPPNDPYPSFLGCTVHVRSKGRQRGEARDLRLVLFFRASHTTLTKMSARTKLFRKLVAVSLSENFRSAVEVQSCPIPTPAAGELLVKNKYAGVNASDVNWTAGRYIPGIQPPFDTGFEGLGKIVQVGEGCGTYKLGDVVGYMTGAAFGEYSLIPEKRAFPVPKLDPAYIPLLVSGLTASLSLEKVGQIRPGMTVLVTAAAGGTGQLAVQLAKLSKCHVIGTCSSDKKAEFLRSIGCDRPINYKKESLKEVLKREYPRGLDLVYESVGGEIFNTCVKNLAVNGRLIIIGFVSGYTDGNFSARLTIPLSQILLSKSAGVHGFFLNHFSSDFLRHYSKLCSLLEAGKLLPRVDLQGAEGSGSRGGVEGVCDAVEYLYSGRNTGKIVVDLDPSDKTVVHSKL